MRGRSVPYLWWWGWTDIDNPDTPDEKRGRDEYIAPFPQRPVAPPAESSSIQPMMTLPRPQSPQTAHGTLRLDVGPTTAQVYVDGFYVGTIEDIARQPTGLDLAAGWHRLEFRAVGYVTPAVNVTIEADRTLNYAANCSRSFTDPRRCRALQPDTYSQFPYTGASLLYRTAATVSGLQKLPAEAANDPTAEQTTHRDRRRADILGIRVGVGIRATRHRLGLGRQLPTAGAH
jgi:hypothetical protein